MADSRNIVLTNGSSVTLEIASRPKSERLAGALYIIVLTWCLLSALWFALAVLAPRDETDGQQRSGLRLRTDHGTGCHYLETRGGGITPRLWVDGKQMGCRP